MHIWLPVREKGKLLINEELHVEQVGPAQYRLKHSPSWVQGLAAGDEFELRPDSDRGFEMIRRGGNTCVQVMFERQLSPEEQGEICSKIEKAGGFLDGGGKGCVLVFTFPGPPSFSAIEGSLANLEKSHAGLQWMYGNVYDQETGEPLGWWEHRNE